MNEELRKSFEATLKEVFEKVPLALMVYGRRASDYQFEMDRAASINRAKQREPLKESMFVSMTDRFSAPIETIRLIDVPKPKQIARTPLNTIKMPPGQRQPGRR